MSSYSKPATEDSGSSGATRLNVAAVRDDFPILRETVHGKPLVYLDNAASTQKPEIVIDVLGHYYAHHNSNVHRGIHTLSMRATKMFEEARESVRDFLNAGDTREIVFVRGTTEAVNLVAQSYVRTNVGQGDEVLISEMEHHSNIVPWQLLCMEKGAKLNVIPMNDAGELLIDEYKKLLTPRTKIVSVVHVSNSLGTINPVAEMIEMAHERGIPVMLDGAQAAPHMPVDVRELDCDFYAFSSHKIYGPMGTGVLYGKSDLLEAMPPYQSGGDMIKSVTFEKTTYNTLPFKFEAGTPSVGDAVGLGAVIGYLRDIGFPAIASHEQDLLDYATERLLSIDGVRIIGTAAKKVGVISFVIDGIHPHDVGTIVDREGVAIRTGHHCTQPVMQHFDIPATSRASFGIYNTRDDIDALVAALGSVKNVFK